MDDHDAPSSPGCVEGRIEPRRVHAFLHGEDNRKFRSKVWAEFTKVRVAGIVTKGQCIHCNTEISAKRGAGTSALGNHLKRCKARRSVTNMVRQLKSIVMSPEGVALENWRFSQEVARRELSRMIALHGLPLALVDYDGFRRFVSSLNPIFKVVSRKTITSAAHVINLICKAGFEIINPIVHKIRESVKYIHGSTSRKKKFEEIIKQLGITYRKRPNIDIATRWNSTYRMLEICLELKRAFESLAQQDPEYDYAPSLQEWEKAKVVSQFLKTFYDATNVISGSLYPTANLFFHEIWEIKVALDNRVPEENAAELSETIQYMQRKFKRYWKLTWLQITFPVILDPRFKFELVEFRLKQAFGSEEGESKVALLKKVLLDLFKDYSQVSPGNQDAAQQNPTAKVVTNASSRYADWDQHLSENASSTAEVPSELDTYLKKSLIPRTETLDILSWWKSNSVEYPTLFRMARDVLAVPASTVASESAFSTGKRIISDLRSRLTPKNVEALICLQDWIRATSGSSQFQMEGIEDFIELSDQHE
ncbi:unnamed protein product [Urochloa decumbens]|uniref:Transposase n=1 Tax=Urochloa decumbens TaxID=240449 RepID=A0ABC9GG92_9POAL